MKNVSIITFHCADNFGAFWQVYALQKTIQNLGVHVEIIDFRPDELTLPFQDKMDFYSILKERGMLRTIKAVLGKIYRCRNIVKRLRSYESMRKKYLILSKEKYHTSEELKNKPPKYDYYIAGSDQVWNPHFRSKIGDAYFLDFVGNDSVKISYAASIAESVPDNLKDKYFELISKFDYISVREKSAKEFIDSIIPKDIFVHLDPTFLLKSTEWDEIVKMTDLSLPYKYIFVYDLDQNIEIKELADRISAEKGYKVISYSNIRNFKAGKKSFLYSDPKEFLWFIKNSEIVLSSSFHGIAFAIIFKKPFYTIFHKTRGSRIVDLLDSLELQDRVLYKSEELKKINYQLDYTISNQIIDQKKEEAINYLKRALDIVPIK